MPPSHKCGHELPAVIVKSCVLNAGHLISSRMMRINRFSEESQIPDTKTRNASLPRVREGNEFYEQRPLQPLSVSEVGPSDLSFQTGQRAHPHPAQQTATLMGEMGQ